MERKLPDDILCTRGINLYMSILRMIEDTFSLGAAHFVSGMLEHIKAVFLLNFFYFILFIYFIIIIIIILIFCSFLMYGDLLSNTHIT